MRIPLYLVGFEVFSHSVKSSFQHSLTVLYAIGLKSYLRLEAVVPQVRTPFPRSTTQDPSQAVRSSSTGLSPSLAPHSRGVLVDRRGFKGSPTTPHLLALSRPDSVYRLPLSVALTYGIPFGFSCLPVLRRFISRRPLPFRVRGDVPFGDPGFKGHMRLARAFRSLSRPSSLS